MASAAAAEAWAAIAVVTARNLQALRASPLAEISGSLGDLGTLLPLLIALTRSGSISLSSTLVLSGLWNIFTGALFGVPLPVQPMKALAADAIDNGTSLPTNMAAGMLVATAVFLLATSGMLRWFANIVPMPVVKGIQLGAGVSLVLSAGKTLDQSWRLDDPTDRLHAKGYAVFAALLLLATARRQRFPFAVIIFVLGVIGAIYTLKTLPGSQLWSPRLIVPDQSSWRAALPPALGQLPLTTLNSIVAVSHLSADLFPDVREPSFTALGLSVAGMNLLGCWLGAMPVCHGSGGLAAQYRFGARSGASVVLLGVFKLVLGLAFGDALLSTLRGFPGGLLAVLLVAAGVELARVAQTLNDGARDLRVRPTNSSDEANPGRPSETRAPLGILFRQVDAEERSQRWTVMLVTMAGLLVLHNAGFGFVAGMLCHWSLSPPGWTQRLSCWTGRRQGELALPVIEGERLGGNLQP